MALRNGLGQLLLLLPYRIREQLPTPPFPKRLLVGVTLGLALLILVADVLTEHEPNFAIFYLGPIAIATWYLSTRFAVILAGASVLIWLLVDLSQASTYVYPFTPYWNAAVRFGVFLIFTLLFARLRERLRHAEQLATTDHLTHLTNSFAFHVLVDKEIQRSRRHGYPITIAYIDLDNFKLVNDRWGHLTGDEVLHAVAETLQGGLRSFDLVARLGGDEFAIMLPNTSKEVADPILERLRMHLLETMRERRWPVTASLGAVTFVTPPATVNDMLHRADKLMYAVKNEGKNHIKHIVVDAA